MILNKVKSNISINELIKYRELGYIEKVFEEIDKLNGFQEYEFVIYFRLSWHLHSINIAPSNKKQVVFIVSDESKYIPFSLKKQAFAIFRHYLPEEEQKDNIFHLPVGYSRAFELSNNVPFQNRKYNVFFTGNLHVGRAKLYKYLTKLYIVPFFILHRIQNLIKSTFDNKFHNSYIRFSKGFHNGLSPAEYSAELGNSKIVLCPPGLENVETMRLFEGMKAGCILISEPLPAVYCYKDSPIIIVKSWKELDSIIPDLLANPLEMVQIQNKTVHWWQSHCSEKATALYIMNILQQLETENANTLK